LMGGMAASMVAAWGTWLGTGFTAANAFVAREVLNRWKGLDVVVPDALKDVAQAWGLGTIVLGVIALCLVLRTWWRGGRHTLGTGRFLLDARMAMTVPRAASVPALPETWLRRVAGAVSAARLKNCLPLLVLVAALVGLGLGVWSSWQLWGACNPDVWPAPTCAGRVADAGELIAVGPGHKISAFLAAVGTAELVFLQGRLLAIGWQAVRATETRRGLAVIWDVVAFWPRSAHPFTPYPYSQRVVPDLVRRIRWHLADPQRRVVVTAHSQGSVISLAALLWLGTDDRRRVGLLTYGSQLRQQYARAFPAFVSKDLLAEVYSGYGSRWCSLYRDTDPIGGPVLSWDHDRDSAGDPKSRRLDSGGAQKIEDCYDPEGVRRCGPEWRLLDPEPPPDGDDEVAPVLPLFKHSDYPASRVWPAALSEVLPAAPPG
jgi:hypothetical protein